MSALHDLQHLSSPTKDWTPATAVKGLSQKHWIAREFPLFLFGPSAHQTNRGSRFPGWSALWLLLCWETSVAKALSLCPLGLGLPALLLTSALSGSNYGLEGTWGTLLSSACTQGSLWSPPTRQQVGNECQGVWKLEVSTSWATTINLGAETAGLSILVRGLFPFLLLKCSVTLGKLFSQPKPQCLHMQWGMWDLMIAKVFCNSRVCNLANAFVTPLHKEVMIKIKQIPFPKSNLLAQMVSLQFQTPEEE